MTERKAERLLDDLLRCVDVAHDAEHGGDHSPVFEAEGARKVRVDVRRRMRVVFRVIFPRPATFELITRRPATFRRATWQPFSPLLPVVVPLPVIF